MEKNLYCITLLLVSLTACLKSENSDSQVPSVTSSKKNHATASVSSPVGDGKWQLTSRIQNDLEVINPAFQILITVNGSQQNFHVIQLDDGCTHSFPINFMNSSETSSVKVIRNTDAPALS